jgi:hypothetical protein
LPLGHKTGSAESGTPSWKTREIGELPGSLGLSPIEAMVRIATDPKASLELRGRMKAELHQYVDPSAKPLKARSLEFRSGRRPPRAIRPMNSSFEGFSRGGYQISRDCDSAVAQPQGFQHSVSCDREGSAWQPDEIVIGGRLWRWTHSENSLTCSDPPGTPQVVLVFRDSSLTRAASGEPARRRASSHCSKRVPRPVSSPDHS